MKTIYQHIAFDMSSFMWTCLSGGKDGENGYTVKHEEKDVYVNSALYGYDKVMTRMIELLNKYKLTPTQAILAFEGMNSKTRRLAIDNTYKGGATGSRPPEAYEEFHKLREMLKETWKGLGAQTMWQDAAEGDDVLAWLAHNTEENLIVATFDNDLTVLNLHPNQYGARVSTWINEMFEHNKYGLFDYDLTTTYKALVGDSSDNIKGVPGFGPAKFQELIDKYDYDGLREIHNMLLQSNLDQLHDFISGPQDKVLQLIADNAPQAIRCFDLAKVRPEWVNTMRVPLAWEPGKVRPLQKNDDPRLKKWYGASRLVTAETFDQAIEWAMPHILASRFVTLDIETSTPDESDEWLAAQGNEDGLDVFGSYLCGLGLTFGDNNQYTLYFDVKHLDPDGTSNIDSEKVRQFIASIPQEIEIVIQNVSFELAVLFNEWGGRQMDNGYHGFLPNVLDTALEGSYVDENSERGLKERSLALLGYQQQTFKEVTELTGAPGTLYPGGKLLRQTYKTHMVGIGKMGLIDAVEGTPIEREITKEEFVLDEAGEKIVELETRRYKMHELPATHVFGYGADDPICTAALHNYYKLHMQLEHHYQVYLDVEIAAAYQHAKNFIDGCAFSLETMKELEAEDDVTYDKAWAVLRQYLIEKGWDGVNPPVYDPSITAAQVKEAYEIVHKRPMDSKMRNIDKLAKFAIAEDGSRTFGELLLACCEADEGAPTDAAFKAFNDYVQSHFDGEPQFNDGSPKQMQKLMYEVMGLEIKVRNKPTDLMRKAGVQGSPKTDALAIAYAMQDCDEQAKLAESLGSEVAAAEWRRTHEVLDALKLMSMVGTRRSLYYSKYPYFPHWKDGRIRSQHNQAATNTRRASESKPNKQQLPKHPKIEGYASRFRSSIVPHRPGAVIVSIDFKAQELRIIAEYSRDEVMLSMYIGDNLRDQHHLTGLAIAQRRDPAGGWTYDLFAVVLDDKGHKSYRFVKECRNLGKKLNFTAEYGAMAEKVAQTLMISVAEAQMYLDAREEMFPRVQEWKEEVIAEAKQTGVVRTMLGAVRHLGPAFMSDDKWEASKAERQAVNFKVQGSSAEQTKLAEGRMWEDSLFFDFDAVCYGPIHDEIVASVMVEDLPKFLPRMHAAMTANYANMMVPIMGDISFGWDFYSQIEMGPVPSEEAIATAVAELYKQKEAA